MLDNSRINENDKKNNNKVFAFFTIFLIIFVKCRSTADHFICKLVNRCVLYSSVWNILYSKFISISNCNIKTKNFVSHLQHSHKIIIKLKCKLIRFKILIMIFKCLLRNFWKLLFFFPL